MLRAALQTRGRRLRRLELFVGQAADRRLGLVFDLRLARRIAAPAGVDEATLVVHQGLEVVVADSMTDAVRLATIPRRDEQVVLNAREQFADVLADGVERDRTLLTRVASHEHTLVLVDVAGTKLHTQRHTAQLPLVVLRAGLDSVAIVD